MGISVMRVVLARLENCGYRRYLCVSTDMEAPMVPVPRGGSDSDLVVVQVNGW